MYSREDLEKLWFLYKLKGQPKNLSIESFCLQQGVSYQAFYKWFSSRKKTIMNAISFSREKTQILKGIALLLMLVHHTCTPSYWTEDGTALYIVYDHLQASTKMCVYIFAFLVGYGFFCSKNKTLRYSLKRLLLLVVPFWTMLFCLFIPASYASGKLANTLGFNEQGGALKS